jgi:transposase
MPHTIPEINSIIDTNVRKRRDREILRSVLVDGISYETAAEEHDVCRNTVYNVMRRNRDLFD